MKKPFKFASPKQKRITLPSARAPKLKDPAEEPPFFIRGVQAGSRDEWWVSLALEKFTKDFNLQWDYQVPIYGGRRLRGGQVVDFLVHTPIRYTVLDVKGRYWHTGRHDDGQDIVNACKRRNWNLISWFTDQTPTKEAVYSFLKVELSL